MNKTKIEWCDSTWNPVTGCKHGCEYCYARGIAKRFGKKLPDRSGYPEAHSGIHFLESKIKDNPYPFIFEPTFHSYRLKEPLEKTKPQTIFVCSMSDLFGAWVPNDWIEEVFEACKAAPQHRYLFLTKNPKRYVRLLDARLLPDLPNFWYGSTVTLQTQTRFVKPRRDGTKYNTFISIEPIEGEWKREPYENFDATQWVIIGAETGKRKNKIVPEFEWIKKIVVEADYSRAPVFMKDSLIPIVGEEIMRRDFPWGGEHDE